MRRRVAVVSWAMEIASSFPETGSPELAFEVARRAVAASGLARDEIGLTLSASSDMLEGRSFNFVQGLEALGTWPAVHESHVEMDGAWAAYSAWIKILTGEFDSALVVAWGKTSEGDTRAVLNTQLDPFTLAPLGLDHVATAGLQAAAFLRRTGLGVDAMDEAAAAADSAGAANPALARMGSRGPDQPVSEPLWSRHLAREADGACAVVLAAEELAGRGETRPAWIHGADHRAESGSPGHRDLSRSPGTELALRRALELAGWVDPDDASPEVVEVSASFAHQVPLLIEALGVPPDTIVNPSGGALAADPVMATGLVRLAEGARAIAADTLGGVRVFRAIAQASAGHALQQSMVWCLGRDRP